MSVMRITQRLPKLSFARLALIALIALIALLCSGDPSSLRAEPRVDQGDPTRPIALGVPLSDADVIPKCSLNSPHLATFESHGQRWRYQRDPKRPVERWEQRVLQRVTWRCERSACLLAAERERVMRAALLPLYQNMTVPTLERAWGHLMQLRMFSPDSYLLIHSLSGQPSGDDNVVAAVGASDERARLDQVTPSSERGGASARDDQRDQTKERATSSPLALTLCLKPYPTIESINIRYVGWKGWLFPRLFSNDIYKRLNFRRGGPYPLDQKYIEERRAQLIEYYRRLGYRDTKVRIVGRPNPNDPLSYQVEIEITEGKLPTLADPEIVIQDEDLLTADEITEMKRRVYRAINPDRFFDVLPEFFTALGRGRYDKKLIRERAESLERALREEGRVSARVKVSQDERLPNQGLKVTLRLGPKLRVQIIGNRAFKTQELIDELSFIKSGAIDEIELETGRQRIVSRYQSAAYYYVKVRARLNKRSKRELEAQLFIDEGPQVYVGRVELLGVREAYRAQVERVMETRGVAPNGVLNTLSTAQGILQEVTLNQDLKRVLSLYDALGHTRAKLRCAPVSERDVWREERDEEERDVWSADVNRHQCFRVDVGGAPRAQRHLLTIYISVQEGEKTSLNTVDYFPFDQTMDEVMLDQRDELLTQLGFLDELGEPVTQAGLNRSKLELLKELLISHFKRKGHLQAKVTPLCQLKSGRFELTEPKPCDLDALYGEVIERLSFKEDLGPRAEVNSFIIKGHLLTKEEVIQRELRPIISEGYLNADALLLSQNNLRNLGLFRSVKLTPIGLGESPSSKVEPVTLLFELEEHLPWLLDSYFGLTFNTLQPSPDLSDFAPLYTSALTLRHRNAGGRGWEVGGGLSYDNLLFNPFDIRGDLAAWAVGPFLKNQRFLGTYIQLSSELIFEQGLSNQRVAYAQRLKSETTLSYHFYQLSFPRTWGQGLRFDLTLEGRWERQRPLISQQNERRSFGDGAVTFEVSPTLAYDQRDHPIHPTRGFYMNVRLDMLGSEDLTLSLRETLSAQWIGGWFKRKLLLVPTLRLGAVQSSLSDLQLTSSRADFLFIAGGDQVSYPVRGYPIGAINVCGASGAQRAGCLESNGLLSAPDGTLNTAELVGFSGRALVNMSVEARASSVVLPNLWLAVFSDLGAVTQRVSDLSPSSFYPSAGAGLRYLFYGQVPLRLDVAYPLRETIFSPQVPSYYFDFFYAF